MMFCFHVSQCAPSAAFDPPRLEPERTRCVRRTGGLLVHGGRQEGRLGAGGEGCLGWGRGLP